MVSNFSRPVRIISGGQTGVDRAALDVALTLGIEHGGWCPRGRRSEDGEIPARYQLTESTSHDYAVRTRLNVRDADGTLILTPDTPEGGTQLTLDCARMLDKPCLVINLQPGSEIAPVREWLTRHHIKVLNIAGPRASKWPGIEDHVRDYLMRVFS